MMDGMKRALDTRKVDMRALKVASSTILTLAIMAAIFSFSAQSGGESGSLSDALARMLASAFVGGFDAMPSEQQAQLIAQMSWPIRKTAHASEYACLAISLVITCWQIAAWRSEARGGTGLCLQRIPFVGVTAFALAVLYACSDEIHQLFIDGRAGQVADVLVDALGRGNRLPADVSAHMAIHGQPHETPLTTCLQTIRKEHDGAYRSPLSRLRFRLSCACPPVAPRRG